MSDGPLVSVIIPTHGRIEYLRECLASVVGQTHKNWQCFVVSDDPSEFGAKARLIKSFGDLRIVFLAGSGPGANASRNTGLRAASGDFVFFLDDDDLWDPLKVQLHLEAHRSLGADFVWSHIKRRFHSQANCFDLWNEPRGCGESYRLHDNPFPNSCPPSSLVSLSRQCAMQHSWDESLNTYQDFDYFYRVSQDCVRFGFVRKPVTTFRVHFAERTSKGLEKRLNALQQVCAKHDSKLGPSFSRRRILREHCGQIHHVKLAKGRLAALSAVPRVLFYKMSISEKCTLLRSFFAVNPLNIFERQLLRFFCFLRGGRLRVENIKKLERA